MHVKSWVSWVFTGVLGVVVAGSGCATPRATVEAGYVTTFVGAAALGTSLLFGATSECAADESGNGCRFNNELRADVAKKGYVLSGTIIALGLGAVLSGRIGLSHEQKQSATVSLSRRPVAPVSAAEEAKAAAAEVAPYSGPPDDLAVQIAIAAHAGRCQAAALLAHQWVEMDAPAIRSLLVRDTDIARCTSHIGYGM